MEPVPQIEAFVCVLEPGSRPSFEALFWLEHSERAHARTLESQPQRLRYVVGRWLLRKSLSVWFPDTSPDLWRYSQDPSGNIRLAKGLPRVFISTSQCDTAVAVAFSRSGNLGLKIDEFENPTFSLAENSQSEPSELSKIPEPDRNTYLMRWRTVNEAVRNLQGEKSNLDPITINCDMDTGLVSKSKGGVFASFYEERVSMGESDFNVCVAVKNNKRDMVFTHKLVSGGTI